MRRLCPRVPLALTFALATSSLAQNATTSLRGVVHDPSGAVVPGATIALLNNASGQTLTVTSKASGEYQLQQLQPATYDVTVTIAGFASQTKHAELLVNQPATIDFILTLVASNEVVNVTAATETLNRTDASIGNSTSNATIQALPSETRNIPDLLSLNAGVFFIPIPAGTDPALQDSRSGSVNGGRSDQSNVTLDGVDDNDQLRGLAFTGVLRATQDSTEEFRVTTSNANADAGRSSGAQVSLVTKTGTNSFHGALYEYHRPTFTVANDFFLKNSQLASGEANRPPKLIRNIFGGDLGGPVLKDKLFFFVNYEGTRQAESVIVQRTAPTALYQQGVLQYTAAGGGTVALSAAQVAALDAANGCSICNTPAYPNGPGPDPNALAYLQSFPAANGTELGDGLNTGSFTFSSPHPITLNTTIVKFDYLPSSKHRVFARGNLQKDTTGGPEQFPGQGASYALIDNSKGITAGDTWTLTSNLVNDLRYGYVRQGYGRSGIGSETTSTSAFSTPPPPKPAPPPSASPSTTSSTISAGPREPTTSNSAATGASCIRTARPTPTPTTPVQPTPTGLAATHPTPRSSVRRASTPASATPMPSPSPTCSVPSPPSPTSPTIRSAAPPPAPCSPTALPSIATSKPMSSSTTCRTPGA